MPRQKLPKKFIIISIYLLSFWDSFDHLFCLGLFSNLMLLSIKYAKYQIWSSIEIPQNCHPLCKAL